MSDDARDPFYLSRREFLQVVGGAAMGLGLGSLSSNANAKLNRLIDTGWEVDWATMAP